MQTPEVVHFIDEHVSKVYGVHWPEKLVVSEYVSKYYLYSFIRDLDLTFDLTVVILSLKILSRLYLEKPQGVGCCYVVGTLIVTVVVQHHSVHLI